VRRDRHQLALHQAAGAVLREGQALLQQDALLDRNALQHLLLLLRLEVFQQLDRVVGVELADHFRQRLRPQLLDHLVAHGLVEVRDGLRLDHVAGDLHEELALLGLEMLDQVRDVGRVQILDQRLDLGNVAFRQGGGDILQQLFGRAVELFLVGRLDGRAVVFFWRGLGGFRPGHAACGLGLRPRPRPSC
jgi:hypothetical protein